MAAADQRSQDWSAETRTKGYRCTVFFVPVVFCLFLELLYFKRLGLSTGTPTLPSLDRAEAPAVGKGFEVQVNAPGRHVNPQRIAIISSHIPSSQAEGSEKVPMLDHILNKACYAHLWGYDFIFNMTPGFDSDDIRKAPWLEFGTWHRVPHMVSRIQDYDWILYADVDYVIADMSRPLESFMTESELYGKHPSVFVPRDQNSDIYFVFSAFAVFIKNSSFGRAVLRNWMKFAFGLCRNGNFERTVGARGRMKYNWMHSDQPGIWYSLTKTHMEFFSPNKTMDVNSLCNDTNGLLLSERAFGPEINRYFRGIGAKGGHEGEMLLNVPDEQPIIWSNPARQEGQPLNGLGYQMNFRLAPDDIKHKQAFAIHKKIDMPRDFLTEVEVCKSKHGCYANYTADGTLQIGCDDIQYFPGS